MTLATPAALPRPFRRPLALVQATHPLPSVAVTAFFTAVALAAGLDVARSVLLAAAVLVGQASVGWANDYLDADIDRAAGRTDKPIATGALDRELVGRCAAMALLADVPLSLAVGWRAGAAHLVAVGSAWAYDVRLKHTPASALPYVVSFGLVPVIVATALPGAPLPRLSLVAAGAACGVAAHFANTLGDVEADSLTGVRGLPQLLGPSASTAVAAAFVAVAAGLLVLATGAAPLAVAAAVFDVVAAVVVVAGGGRRATAFRLVIAAVAVLVAAFVVTGGSHLTVD